MSREKSYCLRCRKPGMGCKCEKKDKTFYHWHALRPPTSIKNKAKFRKFLDDCPQFANCVPEELYEDFKQLLRDVKYFKKYAWHDWTMPDK